MLQLLTLKIGVIESLLGLLLLPRAAESWIFEFYDDPSCSGTLSPRVSPNPIQNDTLDYPVDSASDCHAVNNCQGCGADIGFAIKDDFCHTEMNIGLKCNELTAEPHDAFLTGISHGRFAQFGPYSDHFMGYAERGCQRVTYAGIHSWQGAAHIPPLYVIGRMENSTCQKKPIEWEYTAQFFTTPDCSGNVSTDFVPSTVKALNTWWGGGYEALVNHVNRAWQDYSILQMNCPKEVDGGYAPYLMLSNRYTHKMFNYYFNASNVCQAVPSGHFGGTTQYYMRVFTTRKACPCSFTDQSKCTPTTLTTTQFDAPDREPMDWIVVTSSTTTSSSTSTSTSTIHSGPIWTWQLYFDHGKCTNPAPSVTGRGDQCVADLSPSLVSHQLQCIQQQVYIVEFDNGHVPGVSSPSCSVIPLDKATWYGPLTNGTTQPLLTLDYATKNASLTPFCTDFLFDGCCDSNDQVVSGPCTTTTTTTTTTSIGMATPLPRAYVTPTPLSGQATPTTYATPTVATPPTAAYVVPTPLPQGIPHLASYTGPVPAVLLLHTPPPSMTQAWTSLTTSLDALSAANFRAVAASVSSSSASTTTITTTTTTTTSEMPWGLPWWGWFLICCGVLLACMVCLAPAAAAPAALMGGGKKKTKSSSGDVETNTTYVVVDEPDALE